MRDARLRDNPAMSIEDIRPGLAGTIETTVAEEHTAPHVGSGQVRVLATPVLVNLLEAAALKAPNILCRPAIRLLVPCSMSNIWRRRRSA